MLLAVQGGELDNNNLESMINFCETAALIHCDFKSQTYYIYNKDNPTT